MAVIPDSDCEVITGCYSPDGSLRVIDAQSGATCRTKETKITWNQTGPQGPIGPQGPQGETGPTGPEGPAGTGGVSLTETVSVKAEVAPTCVANDPGAVDEHDAAAVTLPTGTYLPVFSGVTFATPNNFMSWELDVNTTEESPSRLAIYFGGGWEQLTFNTFTLYVPTPIVVHSAARLGFGCGGPRIDGLVHFLPRVA